VKRFRLSTLAEADLDEIWLYVAGDGSVDAANRLVDDIVDGMVLLASHPKAGRLRDEIAPGLRSFPVEKGHVLIARVLHGSRDQAAAGEE
jgi:toxin ParE1/3/4